MQFMESGFSHGRMEAVDPNSSKWLVTSEGFVLIPGSQRQVRVCFIPIAQVWLFHTTTGQNMCR